MRQQTNHFSLLPCALPLLGAVTFLFAATSTASAGLQAPKGDSLPKAETLIEKHLQATGGKKAHLAHKTRTRYGKLEVKMAGHDFVATVEDKALAPDKFHSHIESDFFIQVTVCDGKNSWEWRPAHSHGEESELGNAGMTILLEGAQARRQLAAANFHATVNWRKVYSSMKTTGIADVNGSQAYRVELTTEAGDSSVQFYDHKTGLMVKRVREASTPMGKFDTVTYFEDYQEFDGVLSATTVRTMLDSPTMGKGSQTWRYSKIEYNKKISPALFEMPEEAKKQLEIREEKERAKDMPVPSGKGTGQ